MEYEKLIDSKSPKQTKHSLNKNVQTKRVPVENKKLEKAELILKKSTGLNS